MLFAGGEVERIGFQDVVVERRFKLWWSENSDEVGGVGMMA